MLAGAALLGTGLLLFLGNLAATLHGPPRSKARMIQEIRDAHARAKQALLDEVARRQPVEQVAADRAMLDVGAFVDPEEAQGRLVLDPVAFDQTLDLGAGDARELAFISIKRTEARGVGLARQAAERINQRLRLDIERLLADRGLALGGRAVAAV